MINWGGLKKFKIVIKGPLETGCQDLKELNGTPDDQNTNPDINVDDASIAETLKDIDDDTKFSDIDVTDYSEGIPFFATFNILCST